MNRGRRTARAHLLCGAAISAVISMSGVAYAQDAEPIRIPSQSLATALNTFGVQTGRAVMFKPELAAGKQSGAVDAASDPELALNEMLSGTGLSWRRQGDLFLIEPTDPQSGSAAGDGADGTVEALIVTAQKREEDIQDVPIAISAFTQEQLTDRQVAGGPDLMTQVPNFTFTKTNFTGYSIQIRGIGTQAISATVDPAVAVAFNNTPFVRNRFFEQEFYDLQRVEVLRGPQGTLYGRNATAGVVNIISAKPTFGYEAKLSADVANYNSTRLEGMVNVPLVEDVVAFRLAGAWTKRDGYATNEITGNPIDGRDLWSTRATLRFTPTDAIDANLIWEHFEEDDDRIRSGKQLCNTHEVTEVAGFPTTHFQFLPNSGQSRALWAGVQATFSQGCLPASLYAPESFQTPNGIALPYYVPLGAVFLPTARDSAGNTIDPYLSRTQSRDLRVIESTVDPGYRAKTDVVELQATFDVSENLSLTSETAWASDFVFSTQDFNRFNTTPGAWNTVDGGGPALVSRGILTPDGFFCDPQIGCANRLVGVDLSTAKSRHFSQELRLASNYDGPFNFSLGANFLRYDTEDKYYVFINSLSLISAVNGSYSAEDPYVAGVSDSTECLRRGLQPADPSVPQGILSCTYIDPNPIDSLNDQGHNYFLSRNPYKLISYAAFGEAYYNITENLKVTAGLRWTVDKKEAPRIPSWLLAAQTAGYPVMEVVEQEWREPTGRLTVDWKPDLTFTDETLLYASYARGYKAGGANPPPYGVAVYITGDVPDAIIERSATNPRTFEAEFVDAFELGSKNTFLDGRMTLNLAGFYYDYKGYQLSQIVDRSAITQNFDSEVWGLELEADWRPLENLKLGLKLGYEDTKVGDGMQAIDLMDRTAGDPNWVVVRPFPSIPSNCILPTWLFVGNTGEPANPELVGLGGIGGGTPGGCELAYVFGFDPVTRRPYQANPPAFTTDSMHLGVINYTEFSTDPNDYAGLVWPNGVVTNRTYPGWDPSTAPNAGQGIFKDLSGNELPNAPHYTATITADYTVPLPSDWLLTLHTDLYYQSEAWTRIFNTEGYDKLKAYTNVNLAAIFTNDDAGWKVMAYVKNVFDRDSITGAFLFSDDVGLTTNVFLTEPRLYGLRVTKEFTGGPWWTGADPSYKGPFPLTVELSGQVQRQDAPYETLVPTWIDAFPDHLNPLGAQNRDLDWGDGRQVKLTWRPEGAPWSVSAAVRYGRTNTDTARVRYQESEVVCGWGGFLSFLCDPTVYGGAYYIANTVYRWSDGAVKTQERHDIVDFMVGRDVGLGMLATSRSTLGLGLRYAQFESRTVADMAGKPDTYLPAGWYFPGGDAHFNRYDASFEANRDFEGTGPMLSWDAAARLFGNDDVGHVDLDWTLSGGALFGKQRTSVMGEETQFYWSGDYSSSLIPDPEDVETTTLDVPPRSKSVTVPVVDLSLGLVYEIQRIRIGAGYRWERYFDAIDGGFEERRETDRTIDGPYFKLSVGFGGG